MTEDLGTFTVRWREATDVFRIEKCYMRIVRREQGDELFVHATGAEAIVHGSRSTVAPDFPMRLSPNAEVVFVSERLDLKTLVGQRFALPVEYDEHKGEHRATVYLGEHENLNDNEVQVLERNGDYIHVRWTGKATNCDFDSETRRYHGVPILIDGWFTVEEKR